MSEPGVILSARGEGETMRNPVGGSIEVKAEAAQTAGAASAIETIAAPGEGPPLHLHADADEIIHFLDGHFRIRIGDERRDAPPGFFAFVPKGIGHTWQNVGDRPARLLGIFVPASAGMERFFAGFGALEDPGPDSFAALAKDSGMEVLGPPLAVSDPL
jgi:quercetin dioxygenase-like cupin family protein